MVRIKQSKFAFRLAALFVSTECCAQGLNLPDTNWPLSYPISAGVAVHREATVTYISDGFVNHHCKVVKSSGDLVADNQACKTVSYFRAKTPFTTVTSVWSQPKVTGTFVAPFQLRKFVIGPSDYPTDAIRADQQGTVVVKLTIAASGKVENCEIAQSSKVKSLDSTACSGFLKKARFSGATLNGSAIDAAYFIQTSFTIGALPPK